MAPGLERLFKSVHLLVPQQGAVDEGRKGSATVADEVDELDPLLGDEAARALLHETVPEDLQPEVGSLAQRNLPVKCHRKKEQVARKHLRHALVDVELRGGDRDNVQVDQAKVPQRNRRRNRASNTIHVDTRCEKSEST